MSHHPFLNPQSSKAILEYRSIHLSPAAISGSGALGTILAVAANGLIYTAATQGFHIALNATWFGATRTLTLALVAGTTFALGVVATGTLFLLNKTTQEPLRLFRLLALMVFLLACIALLIAPLSALQRLIGFCSFTVTAAALVTPLTYYSGV